MLTCCMLSLDILTELDKMNDMKTWTPEQIHTLRKSMNLSQSIFGVRLGVSGNYIYLLEKGVKQPGRTLRLLLGFIEKDLKMD
jgi:DNA-binding transcriptional regulator YiaG